MRIGREFVVLALGAMAVMACGDATNAPPGSGGPAGDPSSGGGGGANTSSGNNGTSGAPDLSAAPGAACPSKTNTTQAIHVTMAVTWPGSVGKNPGSGNVHVWTRSKLTFNGNKITTSNTPCGSVVPDVQTTPVAGGGKVQAEFPPVVWESASMVTFEGTGEQSSFDVNSKVVTSASTALVGLTMADPTAPWPESASGISGVDSDGDSKMGITAVPKKGSGYSLPPTSLLQGKRADKLYIASRTTTALTGVRDTCDSIKGTANVTAFDNHVIGCHIEGGAECNASEQDFIDQNRTIFKVTSATYEGKVIAENATCADVRAALPAQ